MKNNIRSIASLFIVTMVLFGCTKTLDIIPTESSTVESYLKSSYEISNRKTWLEIPSGYASFTQFDYNLDGKEDVIYFGGYDMRLVYTWPGPQFFSGNPLQNVTPTLRIDNIHVFANKMLIGDYDKNGYPDIFLITGMDPYAGLNDVGPVSPLYVMFNKNGKDFNVKTLDWSAPWFNTGASGDIDNDGDLDVIVFSSENCYCLINDGKGNFTKKSLGVDAVSWAERCELIDMNNDGFLDLLYGARRDNSSGTNILRIVWGNGNDFTESNSTEITLPSMMSLLDIDAYDFDKDGFKEVVLPMSFSNGVWKVLVYKTTDNKVFSKVNESDTNDPTITGMWIGAEPISISDVNNDGVMEIVVSDKRYNLWWEYKNGTLYRK